MQESNASKSIVEVSLSDLSAPARLAVRKELRRLETLARGAYKGRFGLVAVTEKRVFFVDRAKINSQTTSFSLEWIEKIETGSTPLGYGRIELYLKADAPAPNRLRFKVVPKTKTEQLAKAISIHSGLGKVSEVGLVADESVESECLETTTDEQNGAGT